MFFTDSDVNDAREMYGHVEEPYHQDISEDFPVVELVIIHYKNMHIYYMYVSVPC